MHTACHYYILHIIADMYDLHMKHNEKKDNSLLNTKKSQETADSQQCLHSAIMEQHGNKYHE